MLDRPRCSCNGKNLCKPAGKDKQGNPKYNKYCSKCLQKRQKQGIPGNKGGKHKLAMQQRKKSYCEHCGFKAIHSIQLDVDHIDGNHENNHPDNLQTLCANCHRLKTFLHKDWENKTHQ